MQEGVCLLRCPSFSSQEISRYRKSKSVEVSFTCELLANPRKVGEVCRKIMSAVVSLLLIPEKLVIKRSLFASPRNY